MAEVSRVKGRLNNVFFMALAESHEALNFVSSY
ncbi:MAG: hypothetical protein ACI84R_003467 [Candidatus Azotimanducaceae bacterium]